MGHAPHSNHISDEKGSRLARPEPIYDTLFNGMVQRVPHHSSHQQHQLQHHMAQSARENNEAVPQVEDDHDTFTLLNSFWFMIASLLQQGTDLLPR